MRKTLLILMLAYCAAGSSTTNLSACGDKLLLVGRGATYPQGYAAAHPAAILLYAPNAAKHPGGLADLVSALRRAGHDARVASDAPAVSAALRSRAFDIILASIAEMPHIVLVMPGEGPHPSLLPVLHEPQTGELRSATNRYGFAVKAPTSLNGILHTIDDVMEKRGTSRGSLP